MRGRIRPRGLAPFLRRALYRRMQRAAPAIVVLAGSSGVGKTTFYESFLSDLVFPFVNADVIAGDARHRGADLSDYAAAVRAGESVRIRNTSGPGDGGKPRAILAVKLFSTHSRYATDSDYGDEAGDQPGFR